MSSRIWTADALRSEARPWRGEAWRMVEAQHIVSTLKLVDDLAEQEVLEAILDETKPPIPPECAHLDYLLATPFRYAPYPNASRFRRAGLSPGVFYAAEAPEVAAVEMAHLRRRFYSESPHTPLPLEADQYTAFKVSIAAATAFDLTEPPFDADGAVWMDEDDYAPCQIFADAAREAGGEAIRAWSARAAGANLALLTCAAFDAPGVLERQTWRLRILEDRVLAICEFPARRMAFAV